MLPIILIMSHTMNGRDVLVPHEMVLQCTKKYVVYKGHKVGRMCALDGEAYL